MFFSKKSSTPNEESVAKKSVKKMDTLVTGMILWGIVASIYWVKKFKEKNDEAHKHEATHMLPHETEHGEHPERKKGILSRIFFGN